MSRSLKNRLRLTAAAVAFTALAALPAFATTWYDTLQAYPQNAIVAAPSGTIGEIVPISAAATNFAATGTGANAATIALSPGQWRCRANVNISTAGGTSGGPFVAGFNTVSATLPTAPAGGYVSTPTLTAGVASQATGDFDVQITAATTYYLVTALTYGSGTPQFTAGGSCLRLR